MPDRDSDGPPPTSSTSEEIGPVHKVIRIVATSETSWADAARNGVREAAKSITDLRVARLTDADLVVDGDDVVQYRVGLELAFQLDRNRPVGTGFEAIPVRRYLVVANQTLASPGLQWLVNDRLTSGPAEFHVLVPEPRQGMVMAGATDPGSGFIDASVIERTSKVSLEEAEQRLAGFMTEFPDVGRSLSGEVMLGDPVSSVRRVLERSSFDEIIVSTLPAGISRWLRLDLPARLQRAVSIPVTSLVQDDSSTDGPDRS